MSFKIIHDTERCIGCGVCVGVCPENWEIVDGKSRPLKTIVSEPGKNQEAADACPVKCITVEEVSGSRTPKPAPPQ